MALSTQPHRRARDFYNKKNMPGSGAGLHAHAFIDGANLYNGVKDEGWKVDYGRLRKWLTDKLHVAAAYLFIGLMPQNSELYKGLQEAGFILVFKPTVTGLDGRIKGNCDSDMVLAIVSGAFEHAYDRAVLVTSDGDFYSTVEFLQKRGQLSRVISPSPNCSILLKRTGAPITYLREIRHLIEYKKKRPPVKTVHHKGPFRHDPGKIIANTATKVKSPQKGEERKSYKKRKSP